MASAPSALEPARSWPAQAVKKLPIANPLAHDGLAFLREAVLSTRDRVAVVVGYQVRYANAAQFSAAARGSRCPRRTPRRTGPVKFPKLLACPGPPSGRACVASACLPECRLAGERV